MPFRALSDLIKLVALGLSEKGTRCLGHGASMGLPRFSNGSVDEPFQDDMLSQATLP